MLLHAKLFTGISAVYSTATDDAVIKQQKNNFFRSVLYKQPVSVSG